jgi:lysozyme family protein
MAKLTQAFFATILKMEGGYQAFPNDIGNYACGNLIGTNMGVSAVAFSDWIGRCPTVAEMVNLEQQTAFNFYSWYFDRYNLYLIQNQKLFELCANNTMGAPSQAIKAEQRALNALGASLAIDGQRGPQTIAALNDAAKKNLPATYNAIRAEWVAYLNGINSEYRAGWIARMDRHFPPMGTTNKAGFGSAGLIILLIIGFSIAKK